MSVFSLGSLRAPVLAFACAVACTLFSYLALNPTIGFDDANITLSYAENIAAGHGYVYNIGGERVEGSTSPLWTAINTMVFFLPVRPENSLAGLGFLIAWATVWLTMLYGEAAFRLAGEPEKAAAPVIAVGFLALPAFFGWVVWSLMDIGFWVLLTTSAFWLTACFALREGTRLRLGMFALVAVLMAVTRPEGIAVLFGFAALIALFGFVFRDGRPTLGPAIVVVLSGGLAFGLLALIRLAYFGDIFPNTYYSKVSTDHLSQAIQGAKYLKGFLTVPLNAGLILLAVALPFLVGSGAERRMLLRLWWITLLASLGGIALYVLIGGDHFGSYRFFLFLYPALLPLAALSLWCLWRRMPGSLAHPALPLLMGLALVLASGALFATRKGGYVHEFRIAEQGREMGRILNRYPGRPSIGVIAAGGIAMTYEGHIYDLLGLNWVEMAHADRHQIGAYVNHGGFSKAVFYKTLPGIVHPQFGDCDKDIYDNNRFFGSVLRGVIQDAEFQKLYDFECFEGLRFYRLAVR